MSRIIIIKENTMKAKQLETLVQLKSILGVICIAVGFFIALWIFSTCHDLIASPNAVQPIQKVIAGPVATTLSIGGEDFSLKLPAEIFAYLIPIVVLFIMAGVAKILMSNGVRLYGSEYKNLMKQLEEMQYELEDNLECIKRSVIVNNRSASGRTDEIE